MCEIEGFPPWLVSVGNDWEDLKMWMLPCYQCLKLKSVGLFEAEAWDGNPDWGSVLSDEPGEDKIYPLGMGERMCKACQWEAYKEHGKMESNGWKQIELDKWVVRCARCKELDEVMETGPGVKLAVCWRQKRDKLCCKCFVEEQRQWEEYKTRLLREVEQRKKYLKWMEEVDDYPDEEHERAPLVDVD